MKKLCSSIIAVFIIVSFLASCQKSVLKYCRPVKMYTTDSFSYYEFTYDGNYLKSTVCKLNNGRLIQTETYTYTAGERLESRIIVDSTGTTTYKTLYYYNSAGKVQQEDYYVLSSGVLHKSSYYVYEYNTDGRLSKYTYYINTIPPFVNSSVEFLSYDADGNYTKAIEKNSLGVTVDTAYYTYDNHPSILKVFNPFDPKESNHNTLEERSRPTGGGADGVVSNSYTYNSRGYPVTYYSLPDGDELYIEYDCDK